MLIWEFKFERKMIGNQKSNKNEKKLVERNISGDAVMLMHLPWKWLKQSTEAEANNSEWLISWNHLRHKNHDISDYSCLSWHGRKSFTWNGKQNVEREVGPAILEVHYSHISGSSCSYHQKKGMGKKGEENLVSPHQDLLHRLLIQTGHSAVGRWAVQIKNLE